MVKGRGYQEGLEKVGKKRSRIGVRIRKSEKERAKVSDEVRCLQKVASFLLSCRFLCLGPPLSSSFFSASRRVPHTCAYVKGFQNKTRTKRRVETRVQSRRRKRSEGDGNAKRTKRKRNVT